MPNLNLIPRPDGAFQVSPQQAPSALAALAGEVCPLARDYPELARDLANELATMEAPQAAPVENAVEADEPELVEV